MWHGGGVGEQRPWVTPVGFGVVGLVIAANAAGDVGLGTSGESLIVTVGVAAYVATAMPFLLWANASSLVTVVLLLGMAASSALIHHGDPTSSGGVGLYLGIAFAPLRLDLRVAAVVSALSVLIFDPPGAGACGRGDGGAHHPGDRGPRSDRAGTVERRDL